ncbi:MAG TPA: helix-turn-helix transcriptional regulator, partial [Solirubrobacteraceae bacterium]|nr:helix-turn-helix transcriptional regulator [Solirubrobacteraceae bacterium]
MPDTPDPEPVRLDPAAHAHACAIGQRVAAHRAERGLTVSALARTIGVSRSMVGQIERGQSRPSVSTLFALAEALQVPVDAFFRDTDQDAASAPAGTTAAGSDRAEPDAARAARYLVR